MMRAYTPKTVEELRRALAHCPADSLLLGGGTDLIIQIRSGAVAPAALIAVENIPEMRALSLDAEALRIGAAVTMEELASFLRERDLPEFRALEDAASDVGSPQVRNRATAGGNIAGASPAGDLLPPLFLHGAEVLLVSPEGERSLPVNRFVLGPGKTARRPREAVAGFRLPRFGGRIGAFVKLGYRSRVTVSRIGLCALTALDAESRVEEIAVVAGAIAPAPLRLEDAEAALTGRRLDAEAAEVLAHSLSRRILEVTPEKFDRDYKAAAARGIAEDLVERLAR